MLSNEFMQRTDLPSLFYNQPGDPKNAQERDNPGMPGWQKWGLGGLAAGAGMAGLNALMPGQEAQMQSVSNFSPQQQQMQSLLMQLLGPQLQQQFGGQQNSFAPIEAQARQGFQQKTIPSIMERFAATNSMESSALPQMLGGAGAEFETGLGALRSQHGFQQQSQLLQLLSSLMQPSQENTYKPRQPGFAESVGPSIISTIMQLIPLAF
jgi:hypothetical protein